MQHTRARFPGALVLAVALACAPRTESGATDSSGAAMAAASDPAVVRQAIEAANAKAMDAINRGDTATALANYAEDAVVMQPGMAMMNGRAAISQGFAGLMAQFTPSNMKFTTSDVVVSGDLAVETGQYEMTLTPKGGKPMNDKGKYLTIWRRQADGSWKIIRDINNSDAAPTG
jgi:uncharacterized protein (TIGR02246 family)